MNEKPIIDGDVLSSSDEINLIKSDIRQKIIDEISNKGFKVTDKEGYIKISKHK